MDSVLNGVDPAAALIGHGLTAWAWDAVFSHSPRCYPVDGPEGGERSPASAVALGPAAGDAPTTQARPTHDPRT